MIRDAAVATEPTRRRRGPITLERATTEVAEVGDREALLQLFFDFSRQFFEYSAVFIVHGDLAEGRDAFGNGAPRERVMAIGVPLDHPSMFATARERGVPVCSYPAATGLDPVVLGDLRRTGKTEVLVVPVVVRGRTVALFIADDGPDGISPTAQGEVATLAALVGREFERLIVRQKLQGFAGERVTESRRIDPTRVGGPKRPRKQDLLAPLCGWRCSARSSPRRKRSPRPTPTSRSHRRESHRARRPSRSPCRCRRARPWRTAASSRRSFR